MSTGRLFCGNLKITHTCVVKCCASLETGVQGARDEVYTQVDTPPKIGPLRRLADETKLLVNDQPSCVLRGTSDAPSSEKMICGTMGTFVRHTHQLPHPEGCVLVELLPLVGHLFSYSVSSLFALNLHQTTGKQFNALTFEFSTCNSTGTPLKSECFFAESFNRLPPRTRTCPFSSSK